MVEWMILMCRATAVRPIWSLMKSDPWSTCRMSGIPHIAHAGSVFRQIACRRARAVLMDEGAPVKTVYPQMARE